MRRGRARRTPIATVATPPNTIASPRPGRIDVTAPVSGVLTDAVRQVPAGRLMSLVCNVTAPLRASTRPAATFAPVVRVMLVRAMRFPWNRVAVPSVADEPTCQNTWHACAPLVRRTTELLAVVSVLPILKMKTPRPLRVSDPVSCAHELKRYTPGTRFLPPRFSPVRFSVVGALAASLYAVTRSFFAWSATASVRCFVLVTTPGGNPVSAVPGCRPSSPVTTVGPVLVIVDPPSTVKLSAVPSRGDVAANTDAGQAAANITVAPRTSGIMVERLNTHPPCSEFPPVHGDGIIRHHMRPYALQIR